VERKLINPIFIMSSERSGSNLLRTLLDNHSMLHGPKAPQILKTFEDILPFYDQMERGLSISQKGIRELFDDIKAVLNHPFHDWAIDGEKDEIAPEAESFLDLWQSFYDFDLKRVNRAHVVCKENNIFDFAFQILKAMPTAKFLYLYRDPRDVAASWMKVPLGFKNVSQAATNWHQEQMKCIKAIKNYSLPATTISYEALINNTPKEMERILTFLGLNAEEACYQTDANKNTDLKWNKYWENLDKPVMKSNAGKYKISLSGEEVKIIETRCKESMGLLGYSLETDANWTTPPPNVADKIYYSKL